MLLLARNNRSVDYRLFKPHGIGAGITTAHRRLLTAKTSRSAQKELRLLMTFSYGKVFDIGLLLRAVNLR